MYNQFHEIVEERPIQSWALVLPISVLDIGSDIIKSPLFVINCLGLAAIEMFGALWSSEYTLKHSVRLLEGAAATLIDIPIKLVFAPIKITLQVLAIIRDPIDVRPFDSTCFFITDAWA
jgi:hypothetical protein